MERGRECKLSWYFIAHYHPQQIDSEIKTSTFTGLRRRTCTVVADGCLDIQHLMVRDPLRCSHRLDAMFEGLEGSDSLHRIRRNEGRQLYRGQQTAFEMVVMARYYLDRVSAMTVPVLRSTT